MAFSLTIIDVSFNISIQDMPSYLRFLLLDNLCMKEVVSKYLVKCNVKQLMIDNDKWYISFAVQSVPVYVQSVSLYVQSVPPVINENFATTGTVRKNYGSHSRVLCT